MWLYYAIQAASVTPVGAATSSIVDYVLSYGPIGVGLVLFALGYIVPKPTMTNAVNAARVDLEKENERLREALSKTEDQRDEALRIAQRELVPLLSQFTATSSALIPLLQELVRAREDVGHEHERRR